MRKRIYAVISAVLVMSLAGCGSSSSTAKESYAEDSRYDSYATAESAAAPEEYYDEYEGDYENYEYPAEAKVAMDTAGGSAGTANDAITEEDVESASAEKASRMLIKNVYMEVESEDVDVMVKNVEKRVDALGGYIESTNINNTKYSSSERKTATIVARIPVEKLDGFVETISAM